jgi:hypothetical protein
MAYFAVALILLCFNFVKVDYDVDDFKLLYPLVGEWTMPFKDGEMIEKWELKYEKMMNGKTLLIKEGEEELQENVNLVLEDRRIYYIPKVKGQNNEEPVAFTLIEIDGNKFIFENKDHDFPQRIIYVLNSSDEFNATIEGETGKGEKKIEYRFKRKKEDANENIKEDSQKDTDEGTED